MPTPGFSIKALGTTTVTADPANDQSLVASSYSMPSSPQDSPPWEIVASGNGGTSWANRGLPLPPYSTPVHHSAAALALAIDGWKLFGWVAMPNGGYELWRWTVQRTPDGAYPPWHLPGTWTRKTVESHHVSQSQPEDLRLVYGNSYTWEFDPVDLQVVHTNTGARSLLVSRSVRLGPEWKRKAVVEVRNESGALATSVELAGSRVGRSVRIAAGSGNAYAAYITLDDSRPQPVSSGAGGPVPGTRLGTLWVARDDGTRTFAARRQVATGLRIGWTELAATTDVYEPWLRWWEDEVAIAVDPRDPNRVAVACSELNASKPHLSATRVWLSGDGGGSWLELDRAAGVNPSVLFTPSTGHMAVAYQQLALPSHDPSPTRTILEWRNPSGTPHRTVTVHEAHVRGAAVPHVGRRTMLAMAGDEIVLAFGAPDGDEDVGPSAQLRTSLVPSPERAGV